LKHLKTSGKILGIILVAIILIVFNSSNCQAINRTIGMESLGYETDINVGAPYSSLTLEFPVPRLARLQSATATLTLTPNAQLNGENIMFFYLNDKLVETRSVKDIRQRRTFTLNLPIDKEFQSNLRLQIKSNMFITDDLCRDYYSGGLFFTVHKDSRLQLTYDMMPVQTVADFFGSFQHSLYVVVPDSAVLPETMPAAWTYGILKRVYPHLDIQIVKASELAGKPPLPRIWVGLRNQLPAYFNKTQTGIALADPNTLLISAADTPALGQLVRQLADLPVFPVNPAASQRITIQPVETPAGKAAEAVSFGNSAAQEGILLVPADFQLYPALLSKIPERMGFHLEGAHTVSFEPARPVRMDVFFNNNLVHSSVLDQTGIFSREVLLPVGLELFARNNLNIQFNYPEEPGVCRVRGKVQAAQIFPNSYMWGAGLYKNRDYAWQNIGLFFAGPGTLLVDEKLGNAELRLVAETILLMNRQLPPGVYAYPVSQPLSVQTTIAPEQYVVVLAVTGNVPPFFQDKMPIALGRDFTVYRKDTQTTLFEYQANVNTVVGRIGQNGNYPLVVLSANIDAAMLADVLRFMNRPGNYERMNGNVMVFRSPARLYSFDVRDKSVRVEQPAAKGMMAGIWDKNRNLIMLVAGLVFLLMLLILFSRHLRRRRNSSQPPQYPSQKNDPPSMIK